jgi:hypothetical protein
MLAGMAREESDREDLLREATALVERIELAPSDSVCSRIVIGFRAAEALSVFFDADPVYQFNTAGELRRAFLNGKLLKAERGHLISLERVRLPEEVQLVRHELTDDQQSALLENMNARLRKLAENLTSDRHTVIGQVPPDADVLRRVCKWLTNHVTPSIANTPNFVPLPISGRGW